MVAIRIEDQLPRTAVDFLRHCYRFTSEEWQHADRLDLPDQGFERIFRSSCVTTLTGWEISQERELHLGHDLSTASGILHEIDIVAKHSDVNVIAELKNRQGAPTKNDILLFFAKILDYLAANPALLLKESCPVFISTIAFDINGLGACLGLGIHPVAPGLRPIPVLVDNAMRIAYELQNGLQLPTETHDSFTDFCAGLNNIWLTLTDTWIGSRLGYRSEDTIVLKAAAFSDPQAISHQLMQLNTDCDSLLSTVREAKQ